MILDTNALSAIAEGDPGAERHFVARAAVIPVIVLGEYRFGVALSRYRRQYERWIQEMISVCRVLDVDEQTAVRYSQIRLQLREAGSPIPSNDAWIAALARQHELPILSHDHHFDLVKGVKRLDW